MHPVASAVASAAAVVVAAAAAAISPQHAVQILVFRHDVYLTFGLSFTYAVEERSQQTKKGRKNSRGRMPKKEC